MLICNVIIVVFEVPAACSIWFSKIRIDSAADWADVIRKNLMKKLDGLKKRTDLSEGAKRIEMEKAKGTVGLLSEAAKAGEEGGGEEAAGARSSRTQGPCPIRRVLLVLLDLDDADDDRRPHRPPLAQAPDEGVPDLGKV